MQKSLELADDGKSINTRASSSMSKIAGKGTAKYTSKRTSHNICGRGKQLAGPCDSKT